MAIIESDAQYHDVLCRITALDALIAGLHAIEAEAIAERVAGRLTDEDVSDVSDQGALGDAIANLNYTLGKLKADAGDWEARDAYGSAA